MPILLDETVKGLDQAYTDARQILGTPNYDILQNPDYASAFSYIAADAKCRTELIEDEDGDQRNNFEQSDFVRKSLFWAYLP